MKIIEIKTVEDFEQLRKLNKKESVLLKIYDTMSKVQLSSIDLKGFMFLFRIQSIHITLM